MTNGPLVWMDRIEEIRATADQTVQAIDRNLNAHNDRLARTRDLVEDLRIEAYRMPSWSPGASFSSSDSPQSTGDYNLQAYQDFPFETKFTYSPSPQQISMPSENTQLFGEYIDANMSGKLQNTLAFSSEESYGSDEVDFRQVCYPYVQQYCYHDEACSPREMSQKTQIQSAQVNGRWLET